MTDEARDIAVDASLNAGMPRGEPQPAPNLTRGQVRRRRVWIKARVTTLRLLLLTFMIIGWEFVAVREIIDPFFISSPTAVVERLASWIEDGRLWRDIYATLLVAGSGWVLSALIGTALGFLLAAWRVMDEITAPFVDALNAMPRIALAPLFILWFGIGFSSKLALIFSVNILIHLIAAVGAAKSVDPDLLTLARTMGAKGLRLAREVTLPWSVPFLMVALRLGMAYALSGAILGELLASRVGLGNLIARSAGILDTSGVIAALLVVVVVAFGLNVGLRKLESRLLRWRPQGLGGVL